MTWRGLPRRTYRQIPDDFADRYAEMGRSKELCWHYRAHDNTIHRWMIDLGEDELKRRRRAFLDAWYAALGKRVAGARPGTKRAKRYVLGRTLATVGKPAVIATAVEE